MKVLWVNPEFLDYRIPVYKYLWDFWGKDNFFLVFSDKTNSEIIKKKTFEAIGKSALTLQEKKIVIKKSETTFSNSTIVIRIPKGLMSLIYKKSCDVYILEGFYKWSIYAMIVAKIKRKKVLLVYERTKHTERNCPRWRTLLRRILNPLIDGFIVNGVLTHDYLYSLGFRQPVFEGGMSAGGKDLANSVAKVSEIEKKQLYQSLGVKRNCSGLVYLYVGQLVERKGVSYLLEAWEKHIKKHPADKLLIVGTGVQEEPLRNRFSDASIYFIGKVPYDDVHLYYSIADVFVNPTLEDNWSLVIPEAMSCSLPVATSIYNGCYPELIKEGENGYTFDTYNINEVADVLSLFHVCNLKKMGKAGLEIEQNYTPEKVAQRIIEACHSIIK